MSASASPTRPLGLKDFWYIAGRSSEIRSDRAWPVRILGEWLVAFRGADGKAAVLLDRCIHRNAQLSPGRVRDGKIQCPYHGWTYDNAGKVTHVPAEGPVCKPRSRGAQAFPVIEQDGYVYVRLTEAGPEDILPFRIPELGSRGYHHIRLVNRFENTVTNCAENFVDIPHTVFVHPGIFRNARYERFTASVERADGRVHVTYRNERKNFGIFSWFLNPGGEEIGHTDTFFMPNVTSVEYRFGRRRRFFITSQSIPVTDRETLVYTDLTYDYGIWNRLAAPIVRRQAQMIIDQDVEILGNQMRTIRKYGMDFTNSEADLIHVMIESIQKELDAGRDPRLLPRRAHEIEFWV